MGRHPVTAQEKSEIIAAWRSSGQAAAAFLRRLRDERGLDVASRTLRAWARDCGGDTGRVEQVRRVLEDALHRAEASVEALRAAIQALDAAAVVQPDGAAANRPDAAAGLRAGSGAACADRVEHGVADGAAAAHGNPAAAHGRDGPDHVRPVPMPTNRNFFEL